MSEKVATIKGNTTAESAIRELYEKHIGSVIIVDKKRICIGIFTARDVIRIIVQKISLDTPISNVMTKNPITIRDTASFREAISLVSSHGIRHLPVVDEREQLVGILSMRSFLDEVVGITY